MAYKPIVSRDIHTLYDSNYEDMSELFAIPLTELNQNVQKFKDVVTGHLKKILGRVNNWKIESFGDDLSWCNSSVPLDMNSMTNKIIILEFFTYCCINCEHVLPLMNNIEAKYEDSPSLVIIGVHSPKHPNEKDLESVNDALKRNNIQHPVINDHENRLWDSLHIDCWPTVLILGPEHRILFSLIGETAIEKIDFLLKTTFEFFDTIGFDLNNTSSYYYKFSNTIKENGEKKSVLYPMGISSSKECLAISDTGHNRLILTKYDGTVLYIIGDGSKGHVDGVFEHCSFNSPRGSDWWGEEVIFVADTGNHCIRLIDILKKTVTTVFEENLDENAIRQFKSPWDVCVATNIYKGLEVVYIAVAGSHQIWGLHLEEDYMLKRQFFSNLKCSPVAGNGREECRNNFYSLHAGFAQPTGICYSELGSCFIIDSESSSLRSLSIQQGRVQTIVGGSRNPCELFCFGDMDGKYSCAKFQHPIGICVLNHSKVLITDSYNHKIKLVDIENQTSVTFAGSGAKGNLYDVSKLNATFNEPSGICFSTETEQVFIVDTNNHCVKIINLKDDVVKLMTIMPPANATCTDSHVFKKPQKDAHFRQIKLGSDGKVTCCFLLTQPEMSLTEGVPQPWTINFVGECTWSISCLSKNIVNLSTKPSLIFRSRKFETGKCSTIAININFKVCDVLKKVCIPRQEVVKIEVELSDKGPIINELVFHF